MLKTSRYFIPAYVFGVLIIVGASISTSGLRRLKRMHEVLELILSEYSLHFFAFGIFAILLAWGYHKVKSSSILMRSGVVAISYGFLIEVYQIFLSYRDFSLMDVAVDGAGVVVALVLFWFVVIKKRLFGL